VASIAAGLTTGAINGVLAGWTTYGVASLGPVLTTEDVVSSPVDFEELSNPVDFGGLTGYTVLAT
jgi:hypothetical protein